MLTSLFTSQNQHYNEVSVYALTILISVSMNGVLPVISRLTFTKHIMNFLVTVLSATNDDIFQDTT